jgi:hypothetical protein
MRMLTLAVLPLALLATAASAQRSDPGRPITTIQCIDVSGRIIPARCDVPAGRLDKSEYICVCLAGGDRVEVPICAKGEKPPPESARFERLRRQVSRDGSLAGDSFEGRPICAQPRNTY